MINKWRVAFGLLLLGMIAVFLLRPLALGFVILLALFIAWAGGGYPSVVLHAVSGNGAGFLAEGIAGVIGIGGGLWLVGTGLMKSAQPGLTRKGEEPRR